MTATSGAPQNLGRIVVAFQPETPLQSHQTIELRNRRSQVRILSGALKKPSYGWVFSSLG